MNIIVINEKPMGIPYTSMEINLLNFLRMSGNEFYEPQTVEEAEDNFWFYEKGKGWFIGDHNFISGKVMKDRIVCERGVNGSIGAFQATGQGSNPCVRSKEK